MDTCEQTAGRHRWELLSRHTTSEGIVRYFACVCGRILVAIDGEPLAAATRVTPSTFGDVP